MFHGFHGGVRPAARKNATRRAVSVPLEHGPERVVLPLSWCGAQAVRVLVREGDTVLVGQPLAQPEGEGLPLHASVSGQVLAIRDDSAPGGAAIVLENDGMEAAVPPPGPLPRRDRPGELPPAEIIENIRAGGVTDDRGRPLYLRLAGAAGRAKVLLVNAVESEPYVTSVHRLLLERPGEVLGGVRLMMRALGLDSAVLAVGGDKPDAIAALQTRLPLRGGDIRLAVLRRRYPMGAEIPLTEQVTGKRTPPGGTPLSVGVLVVPAEAAPGVYDAVYDHKPVTGQIITVAGDAAERPGNYLLPLGTTVEDVLGETGLAASPARILLGGPMTGTAVADLHMPVWRGAGAVLALTARECARYKNEDGACLHCGRCIEACPLHLEPLYLRLHGDAGHWDALEALHVEDCIECGACAYNCPAHIQLTHSIHRAKLRLRAEREEAGEA